MNGPVKKHQFTMTWNQTDQNWAITLLLEWIKPPNLQPLPLLCFTDVAVPWEVAPTGLFLKQPDNLYIPPVCCYLRFPQWCKLALNAHESIKACIPMLSLLLHLHPPQVQGEQKCLSTFMPTFLWADFYFSVIMLHGHLHQCGYLLGPQSELKDGSFSTHLPITTINSHHECRVRKMSFSFNSNLLSDFFLF